MIDRLLAEKLVHKISKHIDNRVTLVDKEGIVIASSDPGFVGIFHKTARDLITSGKDSSFVTKGEAYVGSKAGVNLTFFYKGNPVGVMGIAGLPNDNLLQIGKSVRLSIESMIEYEMLKNNMLQLNDQKINFSHMLIYEHKVDNTVVAEMARKIECDLTLVRLPIIICRLDEASTASVVGKLELLNCNELIFLNRPDGIMILKTISKDMIYSYKDSTERYINDLIGDDNYTCYVGTPQDNIMEFFDSFEALSWLKGYLNKSKGIYYFSDRIFDYCFARLTAKQSRNIFECSVSSLSQKERTNFFQIMEALVENNMKINESAKALGVHRNTFVFKLNKLREELQLDPINNIYHQWLMISTYMYMQRYGNNL